MKIIWMILLLTLSSRLYADTVNTPLQATPINFSLSTIRYSSFAQFTPEMQKMLAGQWHLSVDDYTHYLWLMNNTPNSIYYQNKNLDPSIVLGFNAKDEKEREKYALIVIKNEQARIASELAFQNTFYQLQRQLYPQQKPVSTANLGEILYGKLATGK